MPYLYVSQFDLSGLSDNDQFIEKVPALADDKYYIDPDGETQTVSFPFQLDCVIIRMVADIPVNLCFGENPESDQDHMLLPAGIVARARVTPGHCVAAVANLDDLALDDESASHR